MAKAVYPYNNTLQKPATNMTKGNFGLWYNKLIPISNFDSCKASDEKGDENSAVVYYFEKYGNIDKKIISTLLDNKHQEQCGFCAAWSSVYETVFLNARLKTPLITGIGETHPHEVSIVFDHNLGIPYIPASGVKGLVRFAHTLGLIDKIPNGSLIDRDKEGKPCPTHFDDEEEWTGVSQLFGTQEKRGSVIFLDAYPEKFPDLHVDIINPHYSEYYSDDTNSKPPADYWNPVPLKFLTVAKDTAFAFRALVDKRDEDLAAKVITAYTRALTQEGVGAKTAVGYGIFEIENIANKIAPAKPQIAGKKPVDKFITAIKILKHNDMGGIGSRIDDALKRLESNEDKQQFARAVREHMGKAFGKSKAEVKLKRFLV
jgi:CRISPR-associated protein Cmr6